MTTPPANASRIIAEVQALLASRQVAPEDIPAYIHAHLSGTAPGATTPQAAPAPVYSPTGGGAGDHTPGVLSGAPLGARPGGLLGQVGVYDPSFNRPGENFLDRHGSGMLRSSLMGGLQGGPIGALMGLGTSALGGLLNDRFGSPSMHVADALGIATRDQHGRSRSAYSRGKTRDPYDYAGHRNDRDYNRDTGYGRDRSGKPDFDGDGRDDHGV